MNNEFAGVQSFQPSSEAFMDARMHEQMIDVKLLCTAYFEKPFTKSAKPLTEAVAGHLASVHTVLGTMENDTDDDEQEMESVERMLAYVNGLDAIRVQFLHELCGDEPVSYIKDMKDMDDDEDDDEEELGSAADQIFKLYTTSFQQDLHILTAISAGRYNDLPSTKRKQMLKKVGVQALGVAKIAGGVVAGIAIAKKSKLL